MDAKAEIKSEDDTNFISFFEEDIASSGGEGRISTLVRDVEFVVTPYVGESESSPTHHIFGMSPGGYKVKIGAIWKNRNKKDGGEYFTLWIPDMDYRANLGKMAGQDDPCLQKIIPWDPRPQAN